jgi:hypothetical protein
MGTMNAKTETVTGTLDRKTAPPGKKSLWKAFLSNLHYMIAGVTVALFLGNYLWQLSGSDTWKLVKEKNGVKIYSMKIPGEYKLLFKATHELDYHSIHQAVAGQVANATMETCKNLVLGCLDFQVIEPFSSMAKSDVVMWKVALPGIFKPRENLIQSQIQQDKDTKAVRIDILAAPNKIPMNDGSIRTTHNHCVWTFTPQANGKLGIEYIQDISLGGFFPDLLINLTAPVTMYTWIHDLLPNLIDRPGFRKFQYDFIEESDGKKKDAEAWRAEPEKAGGA